MKILAYIETWQGEVKKSALELLTYASDLAAMQNGSITVLTGPDAGDEALTCIAKYGAGKILVASGYGGHLSNFSSRAESIRQAVEKENADTILFTGSVSGKALAPLVAAKLRAGMVPGIYSLPKSIEPFTVNKKVFSGKAIATVTISTPVRVLILTPNSVRIKENPVNAQTEKFVPSIPKPVAKGIPGIRIVDTIRTNEQVKLTEAEVVVSGGRGLASRENWRFVEELAGLLGGATACSRPAYDEGWCPHDGYVGQTGKVISPNVYFALGISGAVQHLAGVSSSKLIVAVNKDPGAPIFKSADYGIVGDIQDVMPKLIEAFKTYKAQ